MNSTNEGQALFARIQENIVDLAPQLIFSDWLEEQERLNEALLWRGIKPIKLNLYELYSEGYGDGLVSGYGYGLGGGYSGGDGNDFGHGYGVDYGVGFGYVNAINRDFTYIQRRDVWLKKHKELTNV